MEHIWMDACVSMYDDEDGSDDPTPTPKQKDFYITYCFKDKND
jgi:hypothetical protein